jgi:putative hydrolase of the HAD superfamily
MTVRAAVFDLGGVLEHIGPPTWRLKWQRRCGLTEAEFDAALQRADPSGLVPTGGLTESELRARYADTLALSPADADEMMADTWDWYCGVLDEPLADYLRALRPRVKTAILSNSADGARREETRRYQLPDLVDVLVYSHEVGLAKPDPAIFRLVCERLGVEPSEAVFVDDLPENVGAAADLGLHAVLHESTEQTIAAVDTLLGTPAQYSPRRRISGGRPSGS